MTIVRRIALSVVILLLWGGIQRPQAQAATGTIVVEGDHFKVDGARKFLIFVSYFDALRAAKLSEPNPSEAAWEEDLSWLQSKGISGVRVLANWQHYCAGPDSEDGVIGENGVVNNGRLNNLKAFLLKAKAHGIVVDLTFTHNTMIGNDNTLEQYRNALKFVAERIAEFDNVIIDVSNEWTKWTIDGHRMTKVDIGSMVQSVKAGDPDRAATGSTEGLWTELPPENWPGTFEGALDLGFVAHHDPRGATWYSDTTIGNVLQSIRDRLDATDHKVKPIYLQEPKPFDPGCKDNQDTEFNIDRAGEAVANAKFKGAAAWTFHNRASFDLAGTTLQQALTTNEKTAVQGLLTASGTFWGATVFTGSNNPTVPPWAGSSSISLTRMADTSDGAWRVMSNSASWLHPIANSGSGNSVAFNYEFNPLPTARLATLNISGLTVTVTQQPRPTALDFDGDRKSDLAIFRPSTGVWYIRKSFDSAITSLQWGLPGDVPVAADYDGDGKTDIAVYRPTTGAWYVSQSSNGNTIATTWGLPGDEPVPGDYDGDGKTDHAVFRRSQGNWYIRKSSNLQTDVVPWGLPGDVPVPADYNGDGYVDVAYFRPTLGKWYVKLTIANTESETQWGAPGDVPVVGDYDGDGKADRAYFRRDNAGGGVWSILNSLDQTTTTQNWGLGPDVPVPADYNGDGRIDIAVFRPSTAVWWVSNVAVVQFGLQADVPVPVRPAVPHVFADFDGDRATDISVYRPSTGVWYIVKSATQTAITPQWGLPNDVPVAGDYNGDGMSETAVYRPSTMTWYINLATMVTVSTGGSAADITVPGDYDGDGKTDVAMFRASTGLWDLRLSGEPQVTLPFGQAGDIPVPADYNGDGRTDLAVYRPSNNQWWVYGLPSPVTIGTAGDVPVPADYDGDGRADMATYRPSSALWTVRLSGTPGPLWTPTAGNPNDVPVPADYDGDRRADLAVIRPATLEWFIWPSANGASLSRQWGLSNDVPVPRRPQLP
jgi:hypothetical protein